jgi:hypothetical protein
MPGDFARVYRNTGNGFELMPSTFFADAEAKHLLWVDYDNDGDMDVLLTVNNGRYILYRNDGGYTFTDVSVESGLALNNERHYGASFGDYNRDGYLDFYVCTYALDAGPNFFNANNHLYRNNGNGTFTETTLQAGVGDGVALSFQSVWYDYNGDGWLDLFVINDRIFANSLYRNNGNGTFTNVAASAGVTFAGQDPMTATFGDYDNDGDLDLYLTNTGVAGKMPKLLVRNSGPTYTDQAASHGLELESWTWGATWVDFNNNALQDLYVTTGNPSTTTPMETNYFYGNTGSNSFVVNNGIFIGNHIARSHSVARGDFNNDGFYDLIVVNQNPWDVFLWQNSGNANNNHIKITLQGTASNRMAISSYIRVFIAGQQYMQYTHCGENYLGQNSQHHIFGLGTATVVDSVHVTYLSGHTDKYYNLPANAWYHFTEGDNLVVDIVPAGPIHLCQGESVTLQAGIQPSYLWSNGHTGAEITVSEAGQYWVKVTNSFGVSRTDTVEVVVNPLPVVFESSTNNLCHGDAQGSIDLQNLMGVPFTTVTWNNGTLSGAQIGGLPAGNYAYMATDENNCQATGTVTINQPEAIDYNVFVQPETQGSDGAILIFATGGTPPFTLVWNGNTFGGTTLTGLLPGDYELTIVDANGCEAYLTVNVGTTIDVRNANPGRFMVFPNPAKDVVHIASQEETGALQVRIEDLKGSAMHQSQYSARDYIEVPITLPQGMYVVHIWNDRHQARIKLVVQ